MECLTKQVIRWSHLRLLQPFFPSITMPRIRGRSNASMSRSLSSDIDDPLTRALQPSPSETPVEREERLRTEREAKRISDEIDEELRRERAVLKKRKPVRLLLLGQSESGKSTTLKNFQIHYAPQSWRDERAAWRAVVQLNLIRSVALVLDAVASLDEDAVIPPVFNEFSSGVSLHPSTSQSQGATPGNIIARYVSLMTQLRVAERILQRRLSPTDAGEPGDYRSFTADDSSSLIGSSQSRRTQEFFVRSSDSNSWKSRFLRRVSTSSQANGLSETDHSLRLSSDLREGKDVREQTSPSAILYAALPEIRALWRDPEVQGALFMVEGRSAAGNSSLSYVGSKFEDFPGFFLPDAERITSPGYEPSDDDVIRARLRTMGVQEHRFTFERGVDTGREWRVYDIGGSRSQLSAVRTLSSCFLAIKKCLASWLSFFEEMDAIIFLAPISCFDEALAEDPRINRLEDSITLWRTLCRSPLLIRVQLILFLNKIDILRRKLSHGVRIARYVTSFGDRNNDLDTVCKYFKQKFKEIQRQYSPQPRPYYVYLTAVTDTKATGVTLGIVREGILRANLQRADFI